jgi:hypothetical protein
MLAEGSSTWTRSDTVDGAGVGCSDAIGPL